MQIFVRGQDTHAFNVVEGSTVCNVKALISEKEGVCSSEQMLSFGGVPLSVDSMLLSSVGLQEYSTIDVTSRLLGGKVHGSLARAGKVKGQTPKVEPQEKKKKKTGRAKRRIQYNRRFVNVVAQPGGRKKGPNSNS